MTADETLKTLYNEFDDKHQDTFSGAAPRAPQKLDIAPADRYMLEDQYGTVTRSVNAYQFAVENLNDAVDDLAEQAEQAAEDLPDAMTNDRSLTRLTYDMDDRPEQRVSPGRFFIAIEDSLTANDDRMLEDYIAEEFETGESMVESWDNADGWDQQVYEAAEEHDITDVLDRVHQAVGNYKYQGKKLRSDLEDAMSVDEEPSGLIDRLLG